MLSRVTAKNVGDVFLRHSVLSDYMPQSILHFLNADKNKKIVIWWEMDRFQFCNWSTYFFLTCNVSLCLVIPRHATADQTDVTKSWLQIPCQTPSNIHTVSPKKTPITLSYMSNKYGPTIVTFGKNKWSRNIHLVIITPSWNVMNLGNHLGLKE